MFSVFFQHKRAFESNMVTLVDPFYVFLLIFWATLKRSEKYYFDQQTLREAPVCCRNTQRLDLKKN